VVNGTTYKFSGEIGMAPEWETAACGKDCQEMVTACVLAHVNTSGEHIPLWLDSDSSAIGWGQSTSYPYQEGSFFGNIFVSPPTALYCNGKDFDKGLVPGRLGANTANAPYKNPSSTTYCKDYCVAADGSASNDGYKSCGSYKHVVTVWRNFNPTVNYKIVNRHSGQCLDVTGASKDDKVVLNQFPFKNAANQLWNLVQISPLKYRVTNVNSGKVVDAAGGWTGNGGVVQQYTYNGGPNQMWSFTPTGDGFYKFSPGTSPNGVIDVPANSTADSTVVQQYTANGGDNQQWSIIPVY
jgi:hypothetical protein